ncbi:similar to Saccharomyces cerevisiae YPR143W RRP15 Nucleolar protein, constituent of pre-60S ribosomal particles [Maudiozyma barnettii]|uniref:Similar to Saccharomyces cerevisiae YPR143W RRP15 Nucleolar protein, constituent of pre-60S ribosomal particles n=1 Tax=Maudiozyma barnettii TaxID=61262 RepID=A0A8H2ZJ16_9SACH|nr:Rrp15p [Kazachstania barnettii]CAB4256082.1 similar to Saccharomyces cerevisiae YPR143W RRP15 Nucleolar protein, constituent of pre-60S ribosomal particles [Kazachstania barnettii]CAD1784690.1 similar to Saccharomyces cerevisiae YPR143W RRP15 Nucleolar protein, constituent of pre-60S ribosomal particles [Kazachstania barnettii]
MSSKGKVTVGDKKRSRASASAPKEKAAKHNSKVESTSAQESGSELSDDEIEGASADEAEVDAEDEEEKDIEESDDEFPRKKKSKNSKHDDGSNDFSSAMSAILSSHLKAYDRKDPIMARNKKVLKENESSKLEYKAKKALVAEKKKLLTKTRKTEIIPIASDEYHTGDEIREIIAKETRLRKIAQKGVVKLFNAILSTQVRTNKEVEDNMGDIRNKNERRELITEVSKEKFLDLVKAAGDEE